VDVELLHEPKTSSPAAARTAESRRDIISISPFEVAIIYPFAFHLGSATS
jgi:hypothetical protein